MSYLLNCENSNIAIEILNELRDQGINARVVPTPSSIIDGCGLSLVIKSETDFEKVSMYNICCRPVRRESQTLFCTAPFPNARIMFSCQWYPFRFL